MTKETAIEKMVLYIQRIKKMLLRRISHPRGETKLHYDVVIHIRRNYPNVVISAGLGEHQLTHFSRLDSKMNGYTKGELDLELKCKFEEHTDVVSIEFKKIRTVLINCLYDNKNILN